MPAEVVAYIAAYGYLAIFILIFSQEIGIPNPVPNELVLMFSGYLASKGILSVPMIILTSVTADLTGTSLLYFVFYFFGSYILAHKPRWFPVSQKRIDALSLKITQGGLWTIYLGRITPFIRGYTSVITGLLQIKPRVFIPIAIISASTWSLVCVLTGRLLGPYWNSSENKTGPTCFFIGVIVTVIVFGFVLPYFKKRSAAKARQSNADNL